MSLLVLRGGQPGRVLEGWMVILFDPSFLQHGLALVAYRLGQGGSLMALGVSWACLEVSFVAYWPVIVGEGSNRCCLVGVVSMQSSHAFLVYHRAIRWTLV